MKKRWVSVAALALAIGACGAEPQMREGRPTAQVEAEPWTSNMAPFDQRGAQTAARPGSLASCPMITPATTDVVAENVGGGAVLVFTTSDANSIADLRSGVRELGLQIEYAGSPTLAATGPQTGATDRGSPATPASRTIIADTGTTPRSGAMAAVAVPRSTVNVVDIPNGARLEIIAFSPSDVTNVRELAASSAEQLRAGDCPMAIARLSPSDEPVSYREFPS